MSKLCQPKIIAGTLVCLAAGTYVCVALTGQSEKQAPVSGAAKVEAPQRLHAEMPEPDRPVRMNAQHETAKDNVPIRVSHSDRPAPPKPRRPREGREFKKEKFGNGA